MGWEWVLFWAQDKVGKPFAGKPSENCPDVGWAEQFSGGQEVTVVKKRPTYFAGNEV